MKKSKNNNIILGFSFMYLVSVYPTDRSIVSDSMEGFSKIFKYIPTKFNFADVLANIVG